MFAAAGKFFCIYLLFRIYIKTVVSYNPSLYMAVAEYKSLVSIWYQCSCLLLAVIKVGYGYF